MAAPLFLQSAVFTILVLVATAGENPVSKVITLLEDLKKEVEADGTSEATSYGKYACFCKETTATKSTSVTDGEDKIQTLSGDIAKNTLAKEGKETEVTERKVTQKELGEDMTKTVSRCVAAQATFEASQADMAKAIDSVGKAIKAMKAKKTEIGLTAKKGKITSKSLLETDKDVQAALALAGIDPADPAYKYHAKEINDILDKLLKDFGDEKTEGEEKWKLEQTACGEKKDGLNTQLKDNLDAIAAAVEKIEELKTTIAKDRGDLVQSKDDLEEDELYLKDLTTQCEAKAKDYDQRASTRNDEITAFSAALEILTNKVKDNDEVNKRSFVQHNAKVAQAKRVSFLQAVPAQAVTNFLARKGASASQQAMQERVVSLLKTEGSRLGSAELSLMAMKINGPDHFKEVQNMIQTLIEHLLDEVKAEASKKGFCDMEIAKANKDRDHTQAQASEMSTELKQLEATKEELESEVEQLGKDIKDAQDSLTQAAGLRKDDKEKNEVTLKKAKEGRDAVNDAILVLKAFYSQASRARVLLQVSPVDEDTQGPGFGGAYKGSQKGSRAIFELLETISADFQRTMSETETAEAAAAAAFVEFDRTSKANIASKETKTKLDEQDLKGTESSIKNTLDDLDTTMSLQSNALKMIDSLKPACLDAGGMSFKERTTKRNEEIAALKTAICILTPGKTEEDCK